MCQYDKTVMSDELRLVKVICSLTIAMFGTLGNVMSIVLICKSQLYRTSILMMLILDLCVANSVCTVIIMPLVATSSFYQQWPFGDVLCQAFGYIVYVALIADCCIVTNLTVCQYLVVVHRVSIKAVILQRRKYLHLFALLGLPWIFAMCILLIPLTKIWDEFGYSQRLGYCHILNKQNGLGFEAAGSIITICIMTTVILYCYSAILYTQYKSDRRRSRSVQKAAVGFKRYKGKVQRMITTILLNYFFTYLPFLIVCVVDPCNTLVSRPLYTAIIYIGWSHTAINPVIYALMNTQINIMWYNCLKPARLSKRSSSKALGRHKQRNYEVHVG